MRFNKSIHPLSLGIKDILGKLEMKIGPSFNKTDLYVLNYHSTPQKFIPNFRDQLQFYLENFHIIRPEEIESFYSRQVQTKNKPRLLLTFDDGLRNNLLAASELDKLGIKAFFFVVPAFIETPNQEQKAYYLKNIRSVINPKIDSEEEDFTAMSWPEIRFLGKNGHFIGSHTLSHTMLANNSDFDTAKKEIVVSKLVIENEIQKNVNAFCSINNTLLSVGKTEKKLIQENYRFHFTTLPGSNSAINDPLFINRRNVEIFWPDGAFYFSLGKWDTFRWRSKIDQYRKI